MVLFTGSSFILYLVVTLFKMLTFTAQMSALPLTLSKAFESKLSFVARRACLSLLFQPHWATLCPSHFPGTPCFLSGGQFLPLQQSPLSYGRANDHSILHVPVSLRSSQMPPCLGPCPETTSCSYICCPGTQEAKFFMKNE